MRQNKSVLLEKVDEILSFDWHYRAKYEPKKVSKSALKELAAVFQSLRNESYENKIVVAARRIELLSKDDMFATGSMQQDFQRVCALLRVGNGKIGLDTLRELSFGELDYVFAWLAKRYSDDGRLQQLPEKPAPAAPLRSTAVKKAVNIVNDNPFAKLNNLKGLK